MQGGSFFSLLLVYHNQKHISMQKEKSLYPLSLLTAFAASSPKGTPYGNAGNFAATAEAVPLRDDFPVPGEDVA